MFDDENRIEIYDIEHSIDEDRYNTIGLVHNMLFVVYTERKDRLRMISARIATSKERRLYYDYNSSIPVDRHGNLTPSMASKLNAQFSGKRFSRQHISDILAGKADVTRFNLIILNFFNYSQTLDEYPNAKARFMSFIESTNKMLDQCFLGELYISNTYECFVLMCILSDDPLGTYADVWELSYEQ